MKVIRILGLAVLVAVLAMAAFLTSRPAAAQTPPIIAATENTDALAGTKSSGGADLLLPAVISSDSVIPFCRYGVNVISGQSFIDHDLKPLRAGWYLNYQTTPNANQPARMEFVPVIRLSQTSETGFTYTPSGAALQNAITNNPGARWLIGNEPDRRTSIQDNVEPHIYAAAYHELYQLIKQADPTARIIAGTIVQPTPLRLRYLDMVLDSYQQSFGAAMPVDGWSIHNFILNEVSCAYDPGNCWGAEIPPGIDDPFGEIVSVEDNDDFDRFKERVVRFRQWMKDRGYREKPLYLSEYGILMPPDYGFEAPRVNAYMNKTFAYLTTATSATLGYPADGNRLVQKWSWYSVTDQTYNGWLFDSTSGRITAVGRNYAAHTATVTAEQDLAPWRLTTDPASPHYTGRPLSIQLKVDVSNAGNLAAKTGAAVVRFYNGNPAQGGQQIGADQIVRLAGCGDSTVATVNWTNVGPGTHSIYVMVDATKAIAETNETNNTQSFSVRVTQ